MSEFSEIAALCRVCECPGDGVFYGVYTCILCKEFFQSKETLSEFQPCKLNRQCQRNYITGTIDCSECRLKKCFNQLMRHPVRLETCPIMVSPDTNASTESIRGIEIDELLFSLREAHQETCHFTDPVQDFMNAYAYILDNRQNPSATWWKLITTTGNFTLTSEMKGVMDFAWKIPCFLKLPFPERYHLLNEGSVGVLLLRLARTFNQQSNTLTFWRGYVIRRDTVRPEGEEGFFWNTILDFAQKVHSLNLTDDEVNLLCLVLIINRYLVGHINVLTFKTHRKLLCLLADLALSSTRENAVTSGDFLVLIYQINYLKEIINAVDTPDIAKTFFGIHRTVNYSKISPMCKIDALCRVCGCRGDGVYYGVYTCILCKEFFQSKDKLSEFQPCRQNRQCPVDGNDITVCSECRLKKCFDQKMRHPVHLETCPLMDTPDTEASTKFINGIEIDELLPSLRKAHQETCHVTVPRLRPRNACSSEFQQNPSETCWGLLTTTGNKPDSPAMKGVRNFAEKIPCFLNLPVGERVHLLRKGEFGVLLLRLALTFNRESETLTFFDGQVIRRDTVQDEGKEGISWNLILDFAKKVDSLNLTDDEVNLLCLVLIINRYLDGEINVLTFKTHTKLLDLLTDLAERRGVTSGDFLVLIYQINYLIKMHNTVYVETKNRSNRAVVEMAANLVVEHCGGST